MVKRVVNVRYLVIKWLFALGYDGPLQYAMGRDNNPDQIISVLSSPDEIDGG